MVKFVRKKFPFGGHLPKSCLCEGMSVVKTVAIVGGGVGGTLLANRLARRLAREIEDHEVQLLLFANREVHVYEPGFLFVVTGEREIEHYTRPQKSLVRRGVRLLLEEVQRIDVEKKQLRTARNTYSYDILVIATGARPDFDLVPGMREGAHNFYTVEGSLRLRDALANFEKGRILIVQDLPLKCPVAPIEIFFIIDAYLRSQGRRQNVELIYSHPSPHLHHEPGIAEFIAKRFAARGYTFLPEVRVVEVDPQKRVVRTEKGETHEYDLLIAIPKHRGAPVIEASGLGDTLGFLPTDRYTLKLAGQDDVYVIGDATNIPISKAGSAAHYQAESLVNNIVHRLRGLPETARYDGKLACFLVSDLHESSFIGCDYNTPPRPIPSTELLYWFKGMYNEMYWLTARGLL